VKPIALLLSVGLVAGCTPSGGASVPTFHASASAGLPVDASIAAVSVSHPTPLASAAMQACGVHDASLGVGRVAAMGLVPHARDVVRYVPFVGVEPVIQSDAPAFVIEFRGPVGIPLAHETALDPVCLYIGGGAGLYLTGGYTPDGGAPVTPLPDRSRPVMALPSPAP
jgi:hypothetical protein